MKHLEKLKDMLNSELEILAKKNSITMADLEKIHKLTDTIKNVDKIEMLEENEGGQSYARGRLNRTYNMGGRSYDDGESYARGRGKNAKRDSMGRYASDSGYAEDDYSIKGSSYARGGNRGYSRNYSEAEGKEEMIEMLEDMMDDAETEKERRAIHECMQKIKMG